MSNTNEKMTVSTLLAKDSIKALGSNLGLTREQIARAKSSALTLQSKDALRNADPFSLIRFCFETARYNFAREDQVYAVPYKDNASGKVLVQTQLGYKGLRELAMRSGEYSKISASVVKDCDKVFIDEDTGEIIVKFNTSIIERNKAKETIGYYAFAKDKNNNLVNTIYMSIEDIENHKKRFSKAGDSKYSPWVTAFDEMAKKTLIKKLTNELKQTPELTSALQLDQLVLGSENQSDKYLDNPQNNVENNVEKTTVNNKVEIPSEDNIAPFENVGTVENATINDNGELV